jgi:hypothetical protein
VRIAALKEAVLRVAPFRAFFDSFSNKKVPGAVPFREFLVKRADIHEAHTDDCMAHILADADEAGLTRTLNAAAYVDLAGVPREPTPEAEAEAETEPTVGPIEEPVEAVERIEPDTPTPALTLAEEEEKIPQAIFVAGRKGESLDQLTKILDEYKIPYKLAEDEPNVGRPISTKVAEVMRQCGAAIIVFTPDEELRDLDGKPVWRPSQNMVHELGAAGMAYGNRIVIFREERVVLAANYGDIGHISFTEGERRAKAIDLFRELIAFGLVKVTVG